MTTLQSIVEAVNAAVRINENFAATSSSAIFAMRAAETSGLTWAYYGGTYNGNTIANDDVALADDADNYVVVLRSSGVVSVSTATTHWLSSSYARLYKVTAAGGVVTAIVDHRMDTNGLQFTIGGAGTGDVVGPGVAVDGHLVQFDSTTGKLIKDGGIAIDTDGTMAANSDTRLASQKAVKTYVGAAVTGLLDYKGATDCSANPNYPAASKGDAYQASVAGKIGGGSGTSVDVGDWFIANADNAGGTEASVGTSWGHIEHNLLGALVAADIGVTVQGYDADLAAIAALTATTDSFLQAKASAWTARTIAQVTTDLQGTGSSASSAGFRGIPPNSQSAAYTTVLADAGGSIDHPATDTNARTFTIDSNANVAYPIGTCITFTNMTSQVVTIAITADTLYLAGTGTTGSRSLAQYGMATAKKQTATTWLISGSGLT